MEAIIVWVVEGLGLGLGSAAVNPVEGEVLVALAEEPVVGFRVGGPGGESVANVLGSVVVGLLSLGQDARVIRVQVVADPTKEREIAVVREPEILASGLVVIVIEIDRESVVASRAETETLLVPVTDGEVSTNPANVNAILLALELAITLDGWLRRWRRVGRTRRGARRRRTRRGWGTGRTTGRTVCATFEATGGQGVQASCQTSGIGFAVNGNRDGEAEVCDSTEEGNENAFGGDHGDESNAVEAGLVCRKNGRLIVERGTETSS